MPRSSQISLAMSRTSFCFAFLLIQVYLIWYTKDVKSKLSFYALYGNTPKRVTSWRGPISALVHLRATQLLSKKFRSFGEPFQRCVHLTGPRFKPQSYHSRGKCITARPPGRLYYPNGAKCFFFEKSQKSPECGGFYSRPLWSTKAGNSALKPPSIIRLNCTVYSACAPLRCFSKEKILTVVHVLPALSKILIALASKRSKLCY